MVGPLCSWIAEQRRSREWAEPGVGGAGSGRGWEWAELGVGGAGTGQSRGVGAEATCWFPLGFLSPSPRGLEESGLIWCPSATSVATN